MSLKGQMIMHSRKGVRRRPVRTTVKGDGDGEPFSVGEIADPYVASRFLSRCKTEYEFNRAVEMIVDAVAKGKA